MSFAKKHGNPLLNSMIKNISTTHPRIGTLKRLDCLPKIFLLDRIIYDIQIVPNIKMIRLIVVLKWFPLPVNDILTELARILSTCRISYKSNQYQSQSDQLNLHSSLLFSLQ